jgi:hypothetical protein
VSAVSSEEFLISLWLTRKPGKGLVAEAFQPERLTGKMPVPP